MTKFFCTVLKLLDSRMTTPEPYGPFHLVSLALLIALCVFLIAKFRRADEKTVRRILLAYSVLCLVLELYKQINFSFGYEDGITFHYQWYAFPFQFCSVPMYVALIAALARNRSVHTACCTFLATFGMIAGLLVMIYPGDIYTPVIGIDIQTTLHHGLQAIIGLWLLVSGHTAHKPREIVRGLCIFFTAAGIALVMDVIAHFAIPESGFNMFFISPYAPSTLPVYSLIYPQVPYIVFLLLYLVPFSALAWGIIALRDLIARGAVKRLAQ